MENMTIIIARFGDLAEQLDNRHSLSTYQVIVRRVLGHNNPV